MSKTIIPNKVKQSIWFKAHGRCSMCNKSLTIDGLTQLDVNIGEYAHIIADSPEGPRGDAILSSQLAKEESNLMLLCKEHHKLIDSQVEEFSVDRLKNIKKEHEERIKRLVSIKPNKKTNIVVYTPPIGNRPVEVTNDEIHEAILTDMYPKSFDFIHLEVKNSSLRDDKDTFWNVESEILKQNFDRYIAKDIQRGENISLFAIGPQPLLMQAGYLLGDLYNVEVLQKHREPNTWKWSPSGERNALRLIRPQNCNNDPILIFALSGSEIIERVKTQMGDSYSYWIISCDNPNRNMMQTKDQIGEFRALLYSVLNEINSSAIGKTLNVFPAMPNSCAVEFGRLKLHKSDMPWAIWDKQKSDIDYKATITI